MFDWFKKVFSRKSNDGEGGGSGPKQPADDESNEDEDMPEPHSLTALFRGIYHSVSATQQMLGKQNLVTMDQFFDREDPNDANSRYVPKTVTVKIDDRHEIDVPLFTVVQPRGLFLDKVKLGLSMRIEASDQEKIEGEIGNLKDIERVKFRVSLSPKNRGSEDRLPSDKRSSDTTEIQLEFKSQETPESMMKVLELFTNQIQPRKSGGSDDEDSEGGTSEDPGGTGGPQTDPDLSDTTGGMGELLKDPESIEELKGEGDELIHDEGE